MMHAKYSALHRSCIACRLTAMRACARWTRRLQAYPSGALAYYNCGPTSGASQPHKHVQVVPLPLHGDVPDAVPMSAIVEPALDASTDAEAVVEVRTLPFRAYACRITAGCDSYWRSAPHLFCKLLCSRRMGFPTPTKLLFVVEYLHAAEPFGTYVGGKACPVLPPSVSAVRLGAPLRSRTAHVGRRVRI